MDDVELLKTMATPFRIQTYSQPKEQPIYLPVSNRSYELPAQCFINSSGIQTCNRLSLIQGRSVPMVHVFSLSGSVTSCFRWFPNSSSAPPDSSIVMFIEATLFEQFLFHFLCVATTFSDMLYHRLTVTCTYAH